MAQPSTISPLRWDCLLAHFNELLNANFRKSLHSLSSTRLISAKRMESPSRFLFVKSSWKKLIFLLRRELVLSPLGIRALGYHSFLCLTFWAKFSLICSASLRSCRLGILLPLVPHFWQLYFSRSIRPVASSHSIQSATASDPHLAHLVR